MTEKNNIEENNFIDDLKEIVISSRRLAYSAVNFAQVRQNRLIGQRIVEQEQHGKARAEYGKHIIEIASNALTAEFGKGFSLTNIKNFKTFYLTFNNLQIGQAVPDFLQNQIENITQRLAFCYVPKRIKPLLVILF
jgi:hypothetical protein